MCRFALAERYSSLLIVTLHYIARALAERQGRVTAAIKTEQGVAGMHTHGLTHAYPLERSLNFVRLGINLACARAKCHTPRAAAAASGDLPGLLCFVMPEACVGLRCLSGLPALWQRGMVTEAETVCLLCVSGVPEQQRLPSFGYGGCQGPWSKPLPLSGVAHGKAPPRGQGLAELEWPELARVGKLAWPRGPRGCSSLLPASCVFSSPTDRSMSSSLSASQLHTVSMRDPLNRVLGNGGAGSQWGYPVVRPGHEVGSSHSDTGGDLSPLQEAWAIPSLPELVWLLMFPCLHSKPLPAHLFHPGGQDGWHPHPVCPVVHGGVRGLSGAGQPRQHPPVHALHHGESHGCDILLHGCRVLCDTGLMGQTGTSRGVLLPGSHVSSAVVSQLCFFSLRVGFRAGESVHHVQSQNCPGHHGSQPAPGPPCRC